MVSASRIHRLVARSLWILPAILLFLSVNQGFVAYNIQQTYEHGTDATAEVLHLHSVDRVDVTFDYVDLRVTMPDGTTFEQEQVTLPHTLINEIEGREQVDVRVDRGSPQPVVITDVAGTHMRIALMNALISGMAMVLFAVGVYAWNRYLVTQGDPADQGVERDDAEHPAGQSMRA